MPAVQTYFPPVEVRAFKGQNSANNLADLPVDSQALAKNAMMREIGTIGKRDGSVPVTTAALANPIKHLTIYPFSTPDKLLATSGTTLYELIAGVLTPVTMTNPLLSSNVYDADFTGVKAGALVNIKVIADGGIFKQFNGTVVKDIVPAPDDAAPAPANVLADINALGVKYTWVHSNYVFLTPGDNQIWYSKQATQAGSDNQYDYIPETNYTILVRKGDYINGPGIPFDDVCFIPMRQGWCVNAGTNFNDFDFGEYLNTINGVIAPRTPKIITYANGQQTIAFLSDDGLHEIFTTVLDSRGKQYATRNLMADKINFESYGFTTAEKTAAIGHFIVKNSLYLLEISRSSTTYIFAFDTRNAEFYVWQGLTINAILESDGVIYFAGDDGFLKKFDEDLYSDWTNVAMTTGTPVDFDVYSGLVSFGFDGHQAYLDYYLVEAKQWRVTSKLDVYITYGASVVEVPAALRNQIFVWGITAWGEAQWANTSYTDIVNNSKRIIIKKKGFYFQRRWHNNRDEPVLIYKESYLGRASGK